MDADSIFEILEDDWFSFSLDFETRLLHLADSNMLADCEFIVGPQKTVIKGHKVFFCTASEVFHAMFLGHLKETKAVHVEDLEPDGFQGMKKYIYTGQTHFKSVFEALATYIAARKYLIVQLTRECVKYIKEKLQPSQVLEFFDSCRLNSISVFDDLCTKIINDNTAEIVKSDYFPSANIETIELILKSPSLQLKSEMELFGHFERWALAEAERQEIPAEDIATSFNSLKKHIRFLTISGEDYVARVEPSPLLTREEKYVIAMNKIKFNKNLTSENISMLQKSRRLNIVSGKKHMFQIPINTTYGDTTNTGINLLPKLINQNQSQINLSQSHCQYHNDVRLMVSWTNFEKSICFEADGMFGDGRKMVVIESKLRVLAVNDEDDLFFTKQCECVSINNYNHHSYNSTQRKNRLLLAVIPKSTLKTEHFRNNDRNMISVEGSFTVEQIDL